jgi:RNA polymerase sigma-70 factor (ECF subfamily)
MFPIRAEEASIIAELKAGSEEAYARLLAQYQQPIYSLVVRIVDDPADAVDTTQEVFLKVYRGMKNFTGASSLRTWMYRIAMHEAYNRRRWWSRHKSREISMERASTGNAEDTTVALKDTLVNHCASPFDDMMQQDLRMKVEAALRGVKEPYRTAIILREFEDLSYEEIAEITETSLGTVKSRLTRGREALKKRLEPLLLRPSPCALNRYQVSCCGD